MLTIDGSFGEGGGQILRSSLALSMETGKPFRIENIRAGRKKGGLLRQHLTAVRAAAEICDADTEGAEMRSLELTFKPGEIQSGEYRFEVGTAGSATLVLQTILPALMTADGPSIVTLRGGTHNPWAPPYNFLVKALLPLLERMGPSIECDLVCPGFYPAGGGEFIVRIEPVSELKPLEIVERGEILRRTARAIVSNLPEIIATKELVEAQRKLGWPAKSMVCEVVKSSGPGNILFLEVVSQNITEVFTGFGEKDRPVKSVVGHAVQKLQKYLASGVPVGEYLADQLLVPMALAGGYFHTIGLTRHTKTNIELIRQFVNAEIVVSEEEHKVWSIHVIPEKETEK